MNKPHLYNFDFHRSVETQEKVTYLPSATSFGPLPRESVAFNGGYQGEEILTQRARSDKPENRCTWTGCVRRE